MKNLLLTAICIFIYIGTFAQFGGGSGTESDPYRIYTIAHLEEIGDSLNLGNNLDNKHFRLMNDIVNDSLPIMLGRTNNGRGFCGYFYGGGHTLALNINSDDPYAALFGAIGGFEENVGYVDSLRIVGYLSSNYGGGGVCVNNYGTICRCTTKLRLGSVLQTFGGIAWENFGNIISCTNLTNTTTQQVGGICHRGSNYSNIVDCQNYGHFKIYGDGTGGICTFLGGGNIIGCINYGQISGSSDNITCNSIGGIVGQVLAVSGYENYRRFIMKCKNVGDIQSSDTYYMGGIVGDISGNVSIENCTNYGNISGNYNIGGIVGRYTGNDSIWIMGEGYVYPSGRIVDCYNSGYIHGDSIVGGIAGTFASLCGDTLANCLNIGRVDGSAIYSGHYAFDGYEGFDFWGDSVYFDHNYYDAQMLAYNADYEEGMYEWEFTSQLTGDTPELRAMLGDGWSYAEGRYPIPLGLENDSLAMLFATPIYLYAENADDYDDVDLVQHHFTVGTENSVSWASGSRLNIVGENATILASGSENITANLAGYSFSRRLNLINPVSAEEQVFDDVKIFPNPTSDILNITSSETISEIEIVNVMGQVVRRIEVNSDSAVCDVTDLKAGVYVVRIRTLRYFGGAQQPQAQGAVMRKFIKE